jgi:hypothetical protein
VSTDSIRGDRVKSCGCLRRDRTIERNKNNYTDLTGQRFGKLVCEEYAGSLRGHAAWKCKCDCGNEIVTDSGSLWAGYRVSCGCEKSSLGELMIEKILKENNIKYKKEFSFDDLLSNKGIKLKFDFAIFNEDNLLTRLIEYDGEQHFLKKADKIFSDTLEGRQEKDNIKNLYCLKHDIPLVRIPYWDKTKISYDMLFNDSKYLVKGENHCE